MTEFLPLPWSAKLWLDALRDDTRSPSHLPAMRPRVRRVRHADAYQGRSEAAQRPYIALADALRSIIAEHRARTGCQDGLPELAEMVRLLDVGGYRGPRGGRVLPQLVMRILIRFELASIEWATTPHRNLGAPN